jgi:hypothetical protein
MVELRAALGLLHAQWLLARRDERGEAVSWLLIIIGTIAIAGIAVAAVSNYVQGQTGKLK